MRSNVKTVGNLVLMRLSLTLALLGDWVKTRKEPTELLQFIYLLVFYLEYSTQFRVLQLAE